MNKRDTKRDYWINHLKQFNHSGLSAAEYCRREKLRLSNFYRWRVVLKETTVSTQVPRLVPVVVEQAIEPTHCSLIFNGVELRVNSQNMDLAVQFVECMRGRQ